MNEIKRKLLELEEKGKGLIQANQQFQNQILLNSQIMRIKFNP